MRSSYESVSPLLPLRACRFSSIVGRNRFLLLLNTIIPLSIPLRNAFCSSSGRLYTVLHSSLQQPS